MNIPELEKLNREIFVIRNIHVNMMEPEAIAKYSRLRESYIKLVKNKYPIVNGVIRGVPSKINFT